MLIKFSQSVSESLRKEACRKLEKEQEEGRFLPSLIILLPDDEIRLKSDDLDEDRLEELMNEAEERAEEIEEEGEKELKMLVIITEGDKNSDCFAELMERLCGLQWDEHLPEPIHVTEEEDQEVTIMDCKLKHKLEEREEIEALAAQRVMVPIPTYYPYPYPPKLEGNW